MNRPTPRKGFIYGKSPRYSTSLLVCHTGHQISHIKTTLELLCALVWNLAHFPFPLTHYKVSVVSISSLIKIIITLTFCT